MLFDFSFERLESRRLLSVSLGSNGFTHFGKSDDTRVIYVSSSLGDDKNKGLSASRPVKSLSRAESLLRDNHPDWLLLKRGDRFSGGFGRWTLSGRSQQEPLVIGAYGHGARPLIQSGTDAGLITSGGGHPVDNIVVLSLHFVASTYTGSNGGYQTAGIRLTRQGSNWLVEDCSIEGYRDNIDLDGNGSGIGNFTLRRSEILDAYCASPIVGNGHAQGMYVSGTSSNVTIEQNVFDHNGYKDGLPGAAPTVFNHGIYVNTGAVNTIITGNIITRSSLRGILLRAGGIVEDNLLVNNPVGIQIGNSVSRVIGNVILNGIDQSTFQSGVGIDVIGLKKVRIASNIIAHDISKNSVGDSAIFLETGVMQATLTSNIVYDWKQALRNDAASTHRGINQLDDDHIDYTAPDRSLASYNAALSGRRTLSAFLNVLRNRSETGWDGRYTAAAAIRYIRAGFVKR